MTTVSRPGEVPEVSMLRDCGARVVVVNHGESWTRYLTLWRPIGRGQLREVMDKWVAPVTGESSYSPTGRAFWRAPYIIRRRRVVCVAQSGGLDV